VVIYLDTSTVVKLCVEEGDSSWVKNLVEEAMAVATSLVAYAEARAAFARRYKEKAFTATGYRHIISSLHEDWEDYLVIKVTKELVRLAGDLAEKYGLKGFDAIHLSSAVTLRQELTAPVIFSCADRKLQNASKLERLNQPEIKLPD
jgi:predicted nucleic acid-binding protein